MNLKLVNSSTEYDFSKWISDFSGIRWRTTYLDRFGQPGLERQGDGNEGTRTLTLSYGLNGESDAEHIIQSDALYAAMRKDLAPFYLHDTDTGRRLRVSPDSLDLNPKAGTELRYSSARIQFTALDAFWEALTATDVESGSLALENQDSLTCDNEGVVTVFPIMTVYPSESNRTFSLINTATDDIFTLASNSLVPGTYVEIDSRNESVYLVAGQTRTEISSAIADGTGYLHLIPGDNEIVYESAYGPVTLEISYRRRWPF